MFPKMRCERIPRFFWLKLRDRPFSCLNSPNRSGKFDRTRRVKSKGQGRDEAPKAKSTSTWPAQVTHLRSDRLMRKSRALDNKNGGTPLFTWTSIPLFLYTQLLITELIKWHFCLFSAPKVASHQVALIDGFQFYAFALDLQCLGMCAKRLITDTHTQSRIHSAGCFHVAGTAQCSPPALLLLDSRTREAIRCRSLAALTCSLLPWR